MLRTGNLVDKVHQILSEIGSPQFLHRLELDLAHSLASYRIDLADLRQRMGAAVDQPVAQLQHLTLPATEPVERTVQPVLKRLLVEIRGYNLVVLQTFQNIAFIVVAYRLVERKRVAKHIEDHASSLHGKSSRRRRCLHARLAAMLLPQLGDHGQNVADMADHVCRHSYGARLVDQGLRDLLTYPRRGVGA